MLHLASADSRLEVSRKEKNKPAMHNKHRRKRYMSIWWKPTGMWREMLCVLFFVCLFCFVYTNCSYLRQQMPFLKAGAVKKNKLTLARATKVSLSGRRRRETIDNIINKCSHTVLDLVLLTLFTWGTDQVGFWELMQMTFPSAWLHGWSCKSIVLL